MNIRIQAPPSSSAFRLPPLSSSPSRSNKAPLLLARAIWCSSSCSARCYLRWSDEASSLLSKGTISRCSSGLGALVTSRPQDAPTRPPVGDDKIGVLLLNLGGPETLEDVQPFLFNLFADPDIIRLPRSFAFLQKPLAQFISSARAPKSKEGYASIGGGSPLRRITDAQAWLMA
ncbi:unnamed protein product [Ilex paraguariensis]|uniref:Ferrochelatase n=1 Tax=Ilex paraguariensis TaxID=185542 RepID=A0ABC8R5Q4_9AQUA